MTNHVIAEAGYLFERLLPSVYYGHKKCSFWAIILFVSYTKTSIKPLKSSSYKSLCVWVVYILDPGALECHLCSVTRFRRAQCMCMFDKKSMSHVNIECNITNFGHACFFKNVCRTIT